MPPSRDVVILRELAEQYAALAAQPVQAERRRLWRAHFSLRPTRPPVLVNYGLHNVWCREVFGDHQMACEDPFLRGHERVLRMAIFHDTIGDDFILEPWLVLPAVHDTPSGGWGGPWGAPDQRHASGLEGGAWKAEPAIKEWSDLARLAAPPHRINEAATARRFEQLSEAVGDLLPVALDRGPVLRGFAGDISTTLAQLRGLEQLMLDMYTAPDELHRLLAFMRDGILANQQQAEEAGDWSLLCHHNQAMPYAEELEDRRPEAGPRRRGELWGFCAAQEYTLISPAFHDEFLFQYQLPIMAHFGLVHYGCCEDLTRKIDLLRQAPNLRSIAVTPRADVAACAAQIGADYAMSWRPNPTDMVCCGWDEARIRRIIGDGLRATADCRVHLYLKDVETVQGDLSRLARWVQVVRDEIEQNVPAPVAG